MHEAEEVDRESHQTSAQAPKMSWLSVFADLAVRHARDVVGGALSLAETFERDIRLFVFRFVRDMVLSVVLLFVGFGFFVFGIGVMLVESLGIGTAGGSIIVGLMFVSIGLVAILLTRR